MRDDTFLDVQVVDGPGPRGRSAYEIAVKHGFEGTEQEWLDSFQSGDPGSSAYQLAVEDGFVGSEAAWLASLKGEPGDDGNPGHSAYQVALANGFVGNQAAWLASLKGEPGDPADVDLTDFYTRAQVDAAIAAALENANPPVVLAALGLSPLTINEDQTWSGTITGRTNGSTLIVSSTDSTAITVDGVTATGTFANPGTPVLSIYETHPNATNNGRVSNFNFTVVDVLEGVGLARSAPTIRRSTGPLVFPPKFENLGNGTGIVRPIDWKPGDKAVFRWTNDATLSGGFTEGNVVTLDPEVLTNNYGLGAIAGPTPKYIQMAAWDGTQPRPVVLNWSNVAGVGNDAVPTVTSSASPAGFQGIGGAQQLTSSIPGYFAIVSGADAGQFGLSSSNVISYGALETARDYVVVVEVESVFQVKSAPFTITFDINVNTANVFDLGANIANAPRNTRVFAPNDVTVTGLAPGSSVTVAATGGWEFKKNNAGAYLTSASVTNLDTIDDFSFLTGNVYSVVSPGVLTIGSTTDSISVAVMDNPAAAAFVAPPSQPAAVAGTGGGSNVINYPNCTLEVGGFAMVYHEPMAFRTCTGAKIIGAGASGADIDLVRQMQDIEGIWEQTIWRCPGPADPGGAKPIVNGTNRTIQMTWNAAMGATNMMYATLTGTPNPVPVATQTRDFPAYDGAPPAGLPAPVAIPAQGVGGLFMFMNGAGGSTAENVVATNATKIGTGCSYGGTDVRGVVARHPTAGNWSPTFLGPTGQGTGATGIVAMAWGQ